MRRFFACLFAFAFGAGSAAHAASRPAQFDVPTMKTSIYVGSVTLSTGTFVFTGENYVATYEARVSPWSHWSETGTIAVTFYAGDFERLSRGETIELTGEAKNKKGSPRHASAKAQPTDATSGKLKVRIDAGGTKLIFNGTYHLTVRDADPAAAAPPAH